MEQWGYAVVQSQGGQVQTPTGAITVLQMLNLVGQRGGELVTVVPTGSGSRMTGIRSWTVEVTAFGVVVRIEHDLIHCPLHRPDVGIRPRVNWRDFSAQEKAATRRSWLFPPRHLAVSLRKRPASLQR
jgi:hypothetical protein